MRPYHLNSKLWFVGPVTFCKILFHTWVFEEKRQELACRVSFPFRYIDDVPKVSLHNSKFGDDVNLWDTSISSDPPSRDKLQVLRTSHLSISGHVFSQSRFVKSKSSNSESDWLLTFLYNKQSSAKSLTLQFTCSDKLFIINCND
jgi:hypothetical protein